MKLNCHWNWNDTEIEMLLKLKCHWNWNVTKIWNVTDIGLREVGAKRRSEQSVTDKQKHRQTDISTYRMNRPEDQFFENMFNKHVMHIFFANNLCVNLVPGLWSYSFCMVVNATIKRPHHNYVTAPPLWGQSYCMVVNTKVEQPHHNHLTAQRWWGY